MKIKKFIIYDLEHDEANSFDFSDGANFICSDGNTSGKSCILKSLYFNLGLDIKTFQNGWNYTTMIFKVYYEHNGKQGYIIRAGVGQNARFYVDGNDKALNQIEYSQWFNNLLGIQIKLPLNKEITEMRDVYAAVPLSLFYIDQDNSWSGALYKHTTNLGMYKSGSIPSDIFKYMLGLSNDTIIELEDKKTNAEKNLTAVEQQKNVLQSLKNKFIVPTESVVDFDENAVKEEINKYLRLAKSLSDKINEHKRYVYTKQIEIDKLRIEISEWNSIIKYLEDTRKSISYQCPHCDSVLTTEQSVHRIKLDDNAIKAKLQKSDLEKEIEKLQKDISIKNSDQLGLQQEYDELLKVTETKQGELTLKQHISDLAKVEAKDTYFGVQDDINKDIQELADLIKELGDKIKELKKSVKAKQESLTKTFGDYVTKLHIAFPPAKLNTYAFLDFREIKDSGAVKNQVFLGLYLAYTKMLFDNSTIEIPFAIDSSIKDELDDKNEPKFYELIDGYILSSARQTIAVGLNNKLQYLKSTYNKIEISGRVLSKDNATELKKEFDCIK
jgi:hypothetical protein